MKESFLIIMFGIVNQNINSVLTHHKLDDLNYLGVKWQWDIVGINVDSM